MKTCIKALALLAFAVVVLSVSVRTVAAPSLMEHLNRGVVAVRASSTEAFVSWRMLGTDPAGVAFNLYRSTGGATAVKLNSEPLTTATSYADGTADFSQTLAYHVRPVISGIEQPASETYTLAAAAPVQQYLRIPLQIPAGVTTPDGVTCTYSANDCSVGDLDGDGEYEIIVKWDPSNSQDNSIAGYTGNVYLDAYKLDGTLLWRIDLGRNIRAGAHYTQFMVYDLDGDGKAEVACRTAEGSKGADGQFVADAAKFSGTRPSADIDHSQDRRNANGYILVGPEFLTLFNGQTGIEITSTNYNPPRHPDTLFPTTAQINAIWGDNYGNRIDRFLGAVAYLDGQRPSLVMCRGYYTRAVLVAYDYRDGVLSQRWIFDTNPNGGAASTWAAYRGQGNHNLSVADVDGDGRDEIVYGSCTIDDDGRGLYSTGLGHGDAMHVSDLDPARPGLEVWVAHEDFAGNGGIGHTFRDARTGAVIFSSPSTSDAGRSMTADIDPAHPGYEMWGSRSDVRTVDGTIISTTRPSMNFGIWWDGDLSRELLDGTTISKWDPVTKSAGSILSPANVASNNSTKATPNLSADILGDWREEVIWRESDSSALRLYTTTAPTTTRLYTLMHNRQYRLAIAWQNVAYNQPPYPDYFLGNGMTAPAQPDIVTALASLPAAVPAVLSINRYDPASSALGTTSATFRVTFSQAVTGVDTADFAIVGTDTVTGSVASVTAQSATTYDVLVSSVTGSGTLRLDLKASGTGIVSAPGGVAISGGFTSGELYTRIVLAWLASAPSGGLWSNAAHWDGGFIPDGVGAVPTLGNYDLVADTTVALDSPRTLSGLVFGDTNTASAANWVVSDNGNATNTLTFDVDAGAPIVTVNALGTGATATLNTVVAGSDGLAKAGAGTLVLGKNNTLSGALAVNAGTLRVGGPDGALTLSAAANVASGARLEVGGGSLNISGLVTVVTGSVVIDSGSATLAGGFRTNSDSNGTLRVNGGTLTVSDVSIRRNSAGTVDYNSGFIASGGTTQAGAVWLGNHNSNGAMSVEGGTVEVTGALTIGNNSGSTRGGGLRVTSGKLTVADTAYGIVLTRASGNATVAQISGGVVTTEKITFGYNNAVVAGSGSLTLSGGELYLGTGGLVMNGVAPYTATIALTGGTLGAKADWSTALPITLTNTPILKAGDAEGAPHAIMLSGVLGGAGGFAKTGAGTLTLSAANTFTGAVAIDAGTLNVTGSIATSSAVTVNAGGTLAGTGNAGTIVLASGGQVAPGGETLGTLNASSLTWNGGGRFVAQLDGANADKLVLGGALTKGSAGAYEISVSGGAAAVAGQAYTIATYASTDFSASDFAVVDLPAGYTATVSAGATSLELTLNAPVVDTLAPSVPTNFAGAATSPNDVAISWTASTDNIGVVGYRIYRNGVEIGTSTLNAYTDTGLTSGTAYSYTVSAYDAAGNSSAQSVAISVNTPYSGAVTRQVANVAELRDALTLANTNPLATFTIQLAAGNYTLGGSALPDLAAKGVKLTGPTSALGAGFDGTGVPGGVILKVTASDVSISNLGFMNAATNAIAIQAGANNGRIEDCLFSGPTTGAAISGEGCTGWTIDGNGFTGIAGIAAPAQPAIYFRTGVGALTITDNLFLNCDRAIGIGAGAGENNGAVTIRNNMISDVRTSGHPGAGISVASLATGESAVDNNTVYSTNNYANAIEYRDSVAVVRVRNNLANKAITGTNSPAAALATNHTAAQAAWFTAPVSGDLHLASWVTGVVDAGTAIAGFTRDIDGDTRPRGTAYDIGADEYLGSAPSTPPPPSSGGGGGGGGGGAHAPWALALGALLVFVRSRRR